MLVVIPDIGLPINFDLILADIKEIHEIFVDLNDNIAKDLDRQSKK